MELVPEVEAEELDVDVDIVNLGDNLMDVEIKFKQVVVVPKKPKMSKGKIVSQVAHATYMALYHQQGENPSLVAEWRNSGMCVVVLECKDVTQLMGIAKYCEQWDISNWLYIDEGLTEVEMGTPTAFATGVLTEDKFWIFDKLKLFK